MRYSIIFAGALLAATTVALPAPAPIAQPNARSADGLAVRDTGVSTSARRTQLAKKHAKPDDTDTDDVRLLLVLLHSPALTLNHRTLPTTTILPTLTAVPTMARYDHPSQRNLISGSPQAHRLV